MVTSRSQSRKSLQVAVEDEFNDDNTINAYVSTGKRRSKRAQEEEDDVSEIKETPSAKKRKVLPVREKEVEDLVNKTRPVVEIPARKVKSEPEIPSSSAEPLSDEEENSENSEQDIHEVQEEENVQDSSKAEAKPNTKTKHKRFDSEEPEPVLFSTAKEVPEAIEVADSEESEDSEDDAPEAIGIQEAAKEVKTKEQKTAKAVKEQISATRKKRKERDEILKKQSETGKKRKSESVPEPIPAETSSDEENDDEEPTTRPLTTRDHLPSFLPAEYLSETIPQELASIDTNNLPQKKSKKTKFLDATSKSPKDRRVGATTYRVSKPSSTKLAPKSSFHARSMKEKWLQGRSGKKVDAMRRPFGKAFGRR